MSTEGRLATSTRRVGSLKSDIDRFGTLYLQSKPGRDSQGPNVAVHGALNQFFMGKMESASEENLQGLLAKVIHRLNMMADADEYVIAMGLDFLPCRKYSIENDYKPNAAKDKMKDQAWTCVSKAKLFPHNIRPALPYFTKPQRFLAIALAERCKSEQEMEMRVAKAIEWKELKARELLPHIQAHQVMNNHGIRTKVNACIAAFREMGHRLHVRAELVTPRRRGYSAVPTEDVLTF